MIHIETVKLSEHKDCDRMGTQVKIEGDGLIIKRNSKTLLIYARKDDDLRNIVIHAIVEVLHDN